MNKAEQTAHKLNATLISSYNLCQPNTS